MTDRNEENAENACLPAKTMDTAKTSKPVIPPVAPHHLLPPKEEEKILRRSLKEIGEDMKKMEDLITLTQDIIRRERERDHEFYMRERRRKLSQNPSIPRHLFQIQKIEPREPQPSEINDIMSAKRPSPEPERENKSSLTFRKKITMTFKRMSVKTDRRKNANTDENSVAAKAMKSPKIKLKSISKPSALIRSSPRKYRSRLYFRNGKIGCIDAENIGANKTNIEKTHALVNYITSDLNYTDQMTKRASITSNIDNILSGESSSDDLPGSNFFNPNSNYDYSAYESDDRGIADDGFQLSSVTDMDSFNVQPKSDEDLANQVDDAIEDAVQQHTVDEDVGNNEAVPNMSESASDSAFVNFVDESMSKNPADSEEKTPKPPPSAMSNHSNIT